jgi:shikimate kinase
VRLFLSGVSCVGKTTIGKQLAQEIGFKFFDLDYEVEIFYAKPIDFLKKEFFAMDAFRQKAALVLEKIIDSNQDNYIVALPPSGFMQVYWKKLQTVNPVTVVLTDRAKNIVQRLEFFDQYSNPLAKTDLTESEKTHYLREISLDLKYFGRFYSKADYRIKVAGRGVDEVVREIRMTLKL